MYQLQLKLQATRTTTSHYYIIRIRQKHFQLKELNKKITGQRHF